MGQRWETPMSQAFSHLVQLLSYAAMLQVDGAGSLGLDGQEHALLEGIHESTSGDLPDTQSRTKKNAKSKVTKQVTNYVSNSRAT